MTDDDDVRHLALDALFAASPDPMYLLAPDGRFLAGNEALSTRTGMSWEQLRSGDFAPTVLPEDQDRVAAEFAAAVAGEVRRYRARGIRPDGTVYYADVINAPVLRDGRLVGVIGLARDVDELADVRTSLDRSESLLANAFDGISDAIAFVDAEWRFTFLNRAAAMLLGRGGPDLVGTEIWSLELPDPEGEAMLREAMRTGRPLSRRRFDEALGRWMEVSAFPAGDQLGIQVRDVTEIEVARRRTQDDARLLHARSMLMDDSRDAILMRSLGGLIEYANRSAVSMFGADVAADLVGRPLADVLGLDADTAAMLDLALGRDGLWKGDLVIEPHPGVPMVTENHWAVVAGPDGMPDAAFCVITDVTEQRRRAESEARTQRLESIGTLASGIAHDLNNVLTPLMLATDVLGAGEADAHRLRVLAGMRQTIERGGDMINQVLTYTRGAEGERTVVGIASLARAFAAFCRDVLPKDIDVDVDVDDALAVRGDPTQLLQVLVNLATNARDAMPDGGHLRLHATAAGDTVTIEVSDDGVGMSAETVTRVFEPFYTTKEVGHGTGLGLSVSQAIARSHGGSLEVRSALGEGTTFRLELPRADATEEVTVTDETPHRRLDGVRVLVVDDEDEIVNLATVVVAEAGGTAYGAIDAREAQRILQDSEVDVVVSDLMMPGTPGREFLGWLADNRPGVPVIAMSGVPEQGARAARLPNVRSNLDKPFSSVTLLDAIRSSVEGKA